MIVMFDTNGNEVDRWPGNRIPRDVAQAAAPGDYYQNKPDRFCICCGTPIARGNWCERCDYDKKSL